MASSEDNWSDVVVVVGTGGLGLAAARRIGAGRHIVLADRASASLDRAVEALASSGHNFSVHVTDVSDPGAVCALGEAVAGIGTVRTIVHTAGLSPTEGTPSDILLVNLVGTARVLDAFLPRACPGTVIVCIASQGGYRIPVSAQTEKLMATTPTERLLEIEALDPSKLTSFEAYGVSKRGVHVRVEAVSKLWAARGARAVTISPGFTVTPQSMRELDGPQRGLITDMLRRAGTRMGTPDDVAAVIEFLVSPAASFINGTDLRVDGGVIASEKWADPSTPGSYFPARPPV